MNSRPVVPRERARLDIEQAADYYAGEAGEKIALGFIDAVEAAIGAIGRHPEAGSPRYSYELDIPDLRCWPIKRYPYLAFYVEQSDHIDLWRVLHARRDIPDWLSDG